MFNFNAPHLRTKAKFEGQCRRFKLPSNLSFQSFQEQVQLMYQKSFDLKDIIFRYVDDEKDIIDMETEEEYKEAIRLALLDKEQLLRLTIDKKGSKTMQPNILQEFQGFLTKSFQDTNKIVNQQNLESLYAETISKLGDFEAQKKMQELVTQFGSFLNQIGGQSLSSFNMGSHVNVEPKREIPVNIDVSPIKHAVISSARVVKDVTFEDGSEVDVGSDFTKIWRVKNTGKQAWPQGVSIAYLGGSEELGIPLNTRFTVPVAQQDQEVDISVPLKAPTSSGVIKASFRLVTKEGEEFGNKMDLSVVVIKKAPLIKEDPKPITQNGAQKWATQLTFLRDMGFCDEKSNIELLEKFNGDLTSVVQNVLGN